MPSALIPCPNRERHCYHLVAGRRIKHGRFINFPSDYHDALQRCCWCGTYWDVSGTVIEEKFIESTDPKEVVANA